MIRVALLFLLAGCATSGGAPKEAPVRGVKAALQKLPACQAGADVGLLQVKPTLCTKMFCEAACCNQCSWAATFENKSGQPVPVPPARVQEWLGVPQSALDCEVAQWNEALTGQSVSLEGAGCLVR